MISKQDIENAYSRIAKYIHRTPVLTSRTLSEMSGAELYFKCENFQKVGAFKIRGACNAVFSLSNDLLQSGVATHSSGNHAQALAMAARLAGVKATVIMPDNAPEVKKEAVMGYGASVITCRPTLKDREATLEKFISEHHTAFIHPYNDVNVIAGQATCAYELIEDIAPDIIVAPVGGGGLLSGTALSAGFFGKRIKIYGAEPKGADDAFRSLQAGSIIPSTQPITMADGLLTSLGTYTFPIIQKHVEGIITVSESEILNAMKLIFERMKIVVEPSAAVALAATFAYDAFKGKKVGVILSGGNIASKRLAGLFEKVG